jgi:molecular chaperone GrpE
MQMTGVEDRLSLANAVNELEAAKKRVERDARVVADEMRKGLVEKLLPVLDNLDRTVRAAEASGDSPSVLEGVQMVRSQLEAVLRGYGVERIDALYADFDPALHDAVATTFVTSLDMHDRVVDQLEPGYKFGATLLRPAKVVVGDVRKRWA